MMLTNTSSSRKNNGLENIKSAGTSGRILLILSFRLFVRALYIISLQFKLEAQNIAYLPKHTEYTMP